MPLADALAQRDGAFGAAVDPALLARLDLKPGARITIGGATIEIARHPQDRARQARRRHRLRPARCSSARRRCARPACCSPAAWCAGTTGCGCRDDASDRAAQRGGRRGRQRSFRTPAGRCARRTNASPALERNIERFTQYLTLVGLTALLVGGVGVANAVKQPSRPQARRDRHPEVARRDRRPGVRDLSAEVLLLAAIGTAIGLVDRRGAAVRDRGGVRRASCRCRSRRRCMPASSRWRCSTACSPRSPSRSGRSAAPTTCRSRRCFATRSRRSGAGRAGAMSSLTALVVAALGGARRHARL